MASYDLTGTVKLIMDQQTFASGFSKREFVVTTPDDRFPQDIKLECVKDKCALLERVSVGQTVKVTFDLRGNEYNDKYYVNLTAWRVEAGEASAPNDEVPPFDDIEPMMEPSGDSMPF
jgi:single-strand DNA-binding protein